MNIQNRKTRDAHSLKFTGELTIYEAQNALNQLLDIPEIFNRNIKLDLSEVTECDTAGVQLLMFLNKKLPGGCVLSLTKSNEVMDSLFSLLGLTYLFHREERH